MRKLIPRLSKLLLVTWEISSRTGIWTRQVCQLPEHRRLTIDYLSDPFPQPQLICKLHGGKKTDTPRHLKEALKCLLNKWHREGGLKLMHITKHFQWAHVSKSCLNFALWASFLIYFWLVQRNEILMHKKCVGGWQYLKRWVYDFPLRDRGSSTFFQTSSKPAVGLEVGWPYPLPQQSPDHKRLQNRGGHPLLCSLIDLHCRGHTDPVTVLCNQPAGDWNPTSPLERDHWNLYHLALHGAGYHLPLPATENLLRMPFLSQAFPPINLRGWIWHDRVWGLGWGTGGWKKSLTWDWHYLV